MKLLFAVWTSFLASRMPCPLGGYSWTKEHVAPKSLFPPIVAKSPENIIPFPAKLNHGRGNRKYTSKWDEDGYLLYACQYCPHPGYCRGAAIVTKDGVVPPDPFKGPIARSVLKTVERFPKYATLLNDDVLDYNTAMEWDRRYPMSKAEEYYRSNSN